MGRRGTGWLERPELERRLDGALAHRLTTLTAAAGYGKSALLARWGDAVGAARHRLTAEDRELGALVRHLVHAVGARVPLPRELTAVLQSPLGPGGDTDAVPRAVALGGAFGEALHDALSRDLVVVLDDLDVLPPGGPSAVFIDMLLRSGPYRLHLVTASRTPPPFAIDRLRAQQEVLELTAVDLTLDRDEVRRWTRALTGDDRLADDIAERTAGWPVAVLTLGRRLARLPRSADRTAQEAVLTEEAGHDDLVLAAFEALPAEDRRLTLLATLLPQVCSRLATSLALPADRLPEVHRAGSLLEPHPYQREAYRATPAARSALRPLAEAPETATLAGRAAAWFVDDGRPHLALEVLLRLRDAPAVEQLLTTHGDQLTRDGVSARVLVALDQVRPEFATSVTGRRLRGLACHALGAWEEARRLLSDVVEEVADAGVAWRLGLIHHLRGELDTALDVYARGRDADPTDEATIATSLYATACWLRGERDRCARAAEEALASALEDGGDRPLAAVHTVLAMLAAMDGERRANDAHYRRALEHAERAGDTFQLIRIRTNRASRHIEEGAYADALGELEAAGQLADLTGFSPFTAVTLSNRAEALLHLGRLEEAAVDAAEAVATWQALGSRLVVYGLVQLGTVQRLRGDRVGAAQSLRTAVTAAEAASDVQGLVSALAAEAELVTDEEPEAGLELARRALAHGPGMGYVAACLAATRAAAAAGRRAVAREHLERARAAATTRRDAPALAAATELRAQLDADEEAAQEAIAAWEEVGDPVGRAGAELTRAAIVAADPSRAAVVAEIVARVGEQLRSIGCRAHDERIAGLRPQEADDVHADVAVRTLGGFGVRRGGAALSRHDWQSRKARLLVKLLASRRGAATPRDWLVEHLWPDAEPDVADRRLRVLVSTVRGLLDPEHRCASEHYLVGDRETLRFDLDHVDLDVARVLDDVEAAARLDAVGRRSDALARWRAVESAYTGVFCPEDLYADWSVRIREELRAAYAQACARVAEAEAAAGNHDEAVRRWLRVLETDPYDERAHLTLVEVLLAAGRRGEARRRYRSYAERVRELGLEAAPFPLS